MPILVLSYPLPSEPLAAALRRAAPDMTVWTETDTPPPESVEAILAWRMKPGVLPKYPNLRVLCATGAGVDRLLAAPDLPPTLPVTRVVDPGQGREMAQLVVGRTLEFTRELPRYAEQQARGEWIRHDVRPAASVRIGILGFGAIGLAIARAFEPLGYPVAGWSRTTRDVPGVTSFAGADALAPFLARTDVLVGVLPLTDSTRGLLNRERLAQLPPGAFVINVGRGDHLVEDDLKALLDDGHLAGAALDVFEREPIPAGHWLWSHPKVRLTPHIASQASFEEVAEQCVAALRQVRLGLPPENLVDRSSGY